LPTSKPYFPFGMLEIYSYVKYEVTTTTTTTTTTTLKAFCCVKRNVSTVILRFQSFIHRRL
jgi:hypothetical protein